MKQFSFISIHPKFIESYFSFGVYQAANQKKIAEFTNVNLRDYAVDKHGTIDSAPYGGGDGMIFRPEPLQKAISTLENPHVILTSPRGKLWTQKEANKFTEKQYKNLVFVCGRFGGVDQRFIDKYVDEEYSLGDFIVSGGELPALIIVDSILRLLPGVLGHNESAEKDSFAVGFGGQLEHDLYTRPPEFEGVKVPEVLMSGDHQKIELWKQENSARKTKIKRSDLIK